jgi:hypothetical protein
MTTSDQTTQPTVEVTETQEAAAEAAAPSPTLTTTQEINALRATHQFFSNFDRVPGFAANQWSQALDTIAVVANSLINKTNGKQPDSPDADTDTAASDTTVTQ